MARTSIEIELLAITKEAQKSVDAFAKSANSQLSSISFATSATAIIAGFELIGKVAEKAFDIVKSSIGEAIDQAAEAEKINIQLANALQLSGDFSEEAARNFDEFAKSIQRTSIYSDEAAKSAIVLAKSFNTSNFEAAKLVKVAVDLSARTGNDLLTSVTSLGKTLNGTVDRDLKKYFTALTGLSEAQLRAGIGIDLIADKVKGSGAAIAGSFTGVIAQLKNDFEDVFEEIGKGIVENPATIQGLRELATLFASLAVSVAQSAPEIKEFVKTVIILSAELADLTFGTLKAFAIAIKGTVEVVLAVIRPLIALVNIAVQISAAIFTLGARFKQAQDSFQEFADTLNPAKIFEKYKAVIAGSGTIFDPFINASRAAVKSVEKTTSDSSKIVAKEVANNFSESTNKIKRDAIAAAEIIKKNFESIRGSLEGLGLTDLQKIEVEFQKKRKTIVQAANADLLRDEYGNKLSLEKTLTALRIEEEKKVAEARKKLNLAVGTNPGGEIAKSLLGSPDSALKQGANAQSLGAGFATEVLKGADGAKKLVTSALSEVAFAVAGIPPEIAGPLLDALSGGPEKVKEMVQQFAKAIPEVIKAIVLAIPVLIEELSKAIPQIVTALVDSIPEIINAFIASIPQIAVALSLQMPKVAIALIKGIVNNIPQIIAGFAEAFLELPAKFLDELLKNIPGFGGGGDGPVSGLNIPIISDIFGAIGLAGGGQIPDLPQFTNDRFPARLSGGETVVDKTLTNKLEQFLSQGQSQPTTVVIKVGEKELASVLLDISRRGFRTGFQRA